MRKTRNFFPSRQQTVPLLFLLGLFASCAHNSGNRSGDKNSNAPQAFTASSNSGGASINETDLIANSDSLPEGFKDDVLGGAPRSSSRTDISQMPLPDLPSLLEGSNAEESADALKELSEEVSEDLVERMHEEIVHRNGLSSEISQKDLSDQTIPIVHNEDVQKWINYFTTTGKDRFERHLQRGERLKEIVLSTLEQEEAPPELFYLALIESGFVINAKSHANAVGIWQFISGTATRYGLQVNSYVDERLDPVRATVAAAHYLRDLNNIYQNWYLAMASYNCGEVCVMRAIFRGGSRDFWQLSEGKRLPAETRDYVPKFLAASIISQNPEQYGITIRSAEDSLSQAEGFDIPSAVRLSNVAKELNVTEALLRDMNPHLKRGVTPPGKDSYTIWVPKGALEGQDTAKIVASLKSQQLNLQVAARAESGSQTATTHTVRRGENLSIIAKRHKLSVDALKRMNNMRSNTIRVGQKLQVSQPAAAPRQARTVQVVTHRVAKGDTLGKIANRYKVSVSAVRQANKIRGNMIREGQTLRIPGGSRPVAKAQAKPATPQKYTVRKGDNLTVISKKFGIPAAQIKKHNNKKNANVYAGEILRIPRL